MRELVIIVGILSAAFIIYKAITLAYEEDNKGNRFWKRIRRGRIVSIKDAKTGTIYEPNPAKQESTDWSPLS